MTDSGDFKALVHRRMEATGEKYTAAYRALLDAARGALVPSKHLILPRIAARFDDAPAKPEFLRVHLYSSIGLEVDESELQQYLAADENSRDDLVREWIADRIHELLIDDELIREHEVVFEDQAEDERVRSEAADLGIAPDQYAWLEDRLTDQQWEQLSDEAMHRLLADEYLKYAAGRGR